MYSQMLNIRERRETTSAMYVRRELLFTLHKGMKKPVMGGQTALGGKDVEGTLEEHISEEYVRQVAYAQEPPLKDGKPTYTRHATFPEVIAYLNRREKIGQ